MPWYIVSMSIAGVACLVLLAIEWASGITYMMENHPDYRGEDFLNITGEHEIL